MVPSMVVLLNLSLVLGPFVIRKICSPIVYARHVNYVRLCRDAVCVGLAPVAYVENRETFKAGNIETPTAINLIKITGILELSNLILAPQNPHLLSILRAEGRV